MRFDDPRATVAAQSLRSGISFLAVRGAPSDRARGAHPKTKRRLPAGCARRDSSNNPTTEDQGTVLSTCPPASDPTRSLNQSRSDL
jgi:hypothetical protein